MRMPLKYKDILTLVERETSNNIDKRYFVLVAMESHSFLEICIRNEVETANVNTTFYKTFYTK